MNKKQIERVLKESAAKGKEQYNRIWDRFCWMRNNNLLTDSELDLIISLNHEISKTEAAKRGKK